MGTFMSIVIVILVYDRIQALRHKDKMRKQHVKSKGRARPYTYNKEHDSLAHLFEPNKRKGK